MAFKSFFIIIILLFTPSTIKEIFAFPPLSLTCFYKSSKFSEMLPALIKIVLYALLVYVIYKLIHFFRAIGRVKKASKPSTRPSGLMVKDEMCNTYLPKEHAIKEIFEGKEYYFCSKQCRHKFLEQKRAH